MSRVLRFGKILRVASRYRLDEFIDPAQLPVAARLALRVAPWRLYAAPDLARGERLRLALEELGPVFIKFGQMLSTRRDLLPEDIADELARLQDNVPPFPADESVAIIQKALGKSVTELYSSFKIEPMASASVAQVHEATLPGGESVVVKVVRPDIEPVIREDIALLHSLAKFVAAYVPQGHRLRPVEVVSDYELVILDELDLAREAANGSQLRRNFKDSNLVYIPQVYWDYSSHNVLTMERIEGIPVTDVKKLHALGTDMKLLGERGVEIFFTQVFRDSFFHADMHPGNIFVDATNPADPRYIAVDCAIVGSLSEADQYYLGRNLLAVFQQDYREVARLHVECGWVPPETRVQDFESAMRAVCEPVFERPISEISFGQLLIYLFQTAARFDMEIQPSLVLLQKTLLNIEGLGRQLYPALNLWDTAQPFLEDWVAQRYSPQSVIKRLQQQAPAWLEQLPQLPEAVLESLQQGRTAEHSTVTRETSRQINRTNRAEERSTARWRWLGVVLCVMAGILAVPGIAEPVMQTLRQAPLASWLLGITGATLVWHHRR